MHTVFIPLIYGVNYSSQRCETYLLSINKKYLLKNCFIITFKWVFLICLYNYSYRSADGSARDESGALRYVGTPAEAMAVQGAFAYNSPEGPVQVNYIADEHG